MSGIGAAVVLLSGSSGLESCVGRVAFRYDSLTVLRIPTSKRVFGRRTVRISVGSMHRSELRPSRGAWVVP